MCLLSYFPPKIMPIRERLENGASHNEDGYGWALITSDLRLLTGKSLDAGEAIGDFIAARAAHPDGPALFHSRFSTAGLDDVDNCHPFKVGQDTQTVVAHNGVLFNVSQKETRSDTRIFASGKFAKLMKHADTAAGRVKIENYLGPSNKLVVLTTNPKYKACAYIFNEHAGQWDAGEWHSNGDWKYAAIPYSYGGTLATWWDHKADYADYAEARFDCRNCGSEGSVDPCTYICVTCRCCDDCREPEESCMCFYPQELRRPAVDPDTMDDLDLTVEGEENRAAVLRSFDRDQFPDDDLAGDDLTPEERRELTALMGGPARVIAGR